MPKPFVRAALCLLALPLTTRAARAQPPGQEPVTAAPISPSVTLDPIPRTVEHRPPEPDRPAPRQVELSAGVALVSREFEVSEPDVDGLRSYELSRMPVLQLGLTMHPFAGDDRPLAAGLWIAARLAFAAPPSDDDGDASGMEIEARFRDRAIGVGDAVALSRARLGGELWLGRETFAFDRSHPLFEQLPDTDYRRVRLGASVEVPVDPRVELLAGAHYDVVPSVGRLEDRYDQVTGVGLRAGAGVELSDQLGLRFTASGQRYRFRRRDDAAADAAIDSWVGFELAAIVSL